MQSHRVSKVTSSSSSKQHRKLSVQVERGRQRSGHPKENQEQRKQSGWRTRHLHGQSRWSFLRVGQRCQFRRWNRGCSRHDASLLTTDHLGGVRRQPPAATRQPIASRIKETKGAIIKRASLGQTSVARRHPATEWWWRRWYVPFPCATVAHVRATRGASERPRRKARRRSSVCDSRNTSDDGPHAS